MRDDSPSLELYIFKMKSPGYIPEAQEQAALATFNQATNRSVIGEIDGVDVYGYGYPTSKLEQICFCERL